MRLDDWFFVYVLDTCPRCGSRHMVDIGRLDGSFWCVVCGYPVYKDSVFRRFDWLRGGKR